MLLNFEPLYSRIFTDACFIIERLKREGQARWLSWLKRLTSNQEIPSSNLGRAFCFFFKIEVTSFLRQVSQISKIENMLSRRFLKYCVFRKVRASLSSRNFKENMDLKTIRPAYNDKNDGFTDEGRFLLTLAHH